ncbi:MAG: hypothetical protein ACI9HK_004544, partial [Pirellulaceae bacterium]
PSMLTFDAGSREVCLLRRIRTNTPLQALILMNDPVYFEAGGALGQRMLQKQGNDTRRGEAGFFYAVGRPATAAESERITQFIGETRERLKMNPEEVVEIIKSAKINPQNTPANTDPLEVATWSIYGSVLLNVDEFISRN